jgi:peptidyl-tRNA hydrolase, PTH1 family
MSLFGRKKHSTVDCDLLVVGLGNPGKEYAHTRHNAGADVIALLAERAGERLKLSSKDLAFTADARLAGKRLALAFPQTYMNDSGNSVGRLVRKYNIDDLSHLVVVHDELDLPSGRLQVKLGGGLAGHNGLRSIRDHVKSTDFARIRIGVGKPRSAAQGADHVLSRPSKAEKEALAVTLEEAADAVELIATEGITAAQTRYNTRAQGN